MRNISLPKNVLQYYNSLNITADEEFLYIRSSYMDSWAFYLAESVNPVEVFQERLSWSTQVETAAFISNGRRFARCFFCRPAGNLFKCVGTGSN